MSASEREDLIKETLALVRAIPEVIRCRGGTPLRPLRTNEKEYNFGGQYLLQRRHASDA